MIPIRDVIPSRTTPWVTLGLIGANAAVFIYELLLPPRALEAFFFTHGVVPAAFTWTAAFTSMFVHAGWLHVGGNLLSLWIFGDNVEDRLGHLRYLLFYLGAGLAAALTEVAAQPASPLPLVGASGAIAGVMGAYLVMFPRSRVLVLVILLWIDIIELPAVLFLGLWFLMQIVGGVGRLAESAATGGVAFWAHAGGFAVGALVGLLFTRRRGREPDDRWED